jgi:hypothetical protein
LLALTRVVETDEFDGLEVKLKAGFTAEINKTSDHQFAFHTGNGLSVWSWRRSEPVPSCSTGELVKDRHFWSIQVPLISAEGQSMGDVIFSRDFARGPLQIDVDHLCSLFQKELSQALERVEVGSMSASQR